MTHRVKQPPKPPTADVVMVTCPRCGSEAPWLDRNHDSKTEAVLRSAIAVCDKFATPNELDVLRAAVTDLTGVSAWRSLVDEPKGVS